MNLKEMQDAHAAKLAEVVELRDAAKNRDMTDDEIDTAGKAYAEAKELQEKIVKAQERKAMADKFASIKGPEQSQPETSQEAHDDSAKSIGEQFTSSQQFKSVNPTRSGSWTTGAVEVKASLTEAAGGASYVSTPRVLPGLTELRFQRLTVADLLAQGTTDGPNIRYIVESGWTNTAATVAEAGLKPEDTFTFTTVDEAVKKIAHIATVTDEMLEDVSQIRSYIDNRLVLGVKITEEAQLLNGGGTGTDLTGIMNRTGVLTQAKGTDSDVDAIFKAITKVRTTSTFSEPDAIVINPADWQILRLSKDANNQYYGGGPFTAAYGNGAYTNVDMLWGLRVVITSAMTAGTALVGAFGTEAQLFRRGGLTVEATNSHSTNFAYNLTAIRAEERIGLAVYRPAAFCKVTGIV